MTFETDYAFIGLGRMGSRMAANLRRSLPPSTTLIVNDLNPDACQRFQAEYGSYGPIEISPTAKDAAERASTVISIVTASSHVRSVYLDPHSGVINARADATRLLLECSTIDLETTREVQRRLSAAGMGVYIDAPVSGGVQRASDGSLAFLIGHDRSDSALRQRIASTIRPMAQEQDQVIFCGAFSTGLAAKIANNYIACSNMAVLAEASAMGMANGVDRHALFECFRKSSGYSWAVDYAQPVPGLVPGPASRGYEVSFLMPMILKDMTLGIEMAGQGNTPSTVGAAVRDLFQAADEDKRCKDRDCTSVWLHVSDCRFDPEFDAVLGGEK
ncbi:hypothetical protein FE257_008070 [Aspergillus nanangensis]|uniref:3-hydroxyisobutyrate dehydrogenase n=1 Tax=Aspergillus nanangensis TaxID=2582783 RepID=A0AAD4GV44_ASPNN|nr:hypothetical protein FE257_008070 [Aspergillus nanangensis]